jgi:hypothetical protein
LPAYCSGGGSTSKPYLALAPSIFSMSSGPGGGAIPPSNAGRPTSKKNRSMPAGVITTTILAISVPTFLKACGVPLGIKTTEPALATKVRSPPQELKLPL